MTVPVKAAEGEPSQGQSRTRRTRAAVIDAARQLFLAQGYSATTVDAVSRLSDTPPATVYRLFSSKLGILKALLDVSIAGDDEPVAVMERPQVRDLLAAGDPREQIEGFAAMLTSLLGRSTPVYRILSDASRSEAEAAVLLAEMSRQRQEGQSQVAKSLARSGRLRTGLRVRDAADVIHALASPEVYGMLVLDRGWKPERYRRWIAATLAEQLLG